MRFKVALAGFLLSTSFSAHAIPVFQGNSLITSEELYSQMARHRINNYYDAARLVSKLYEAKGYLGVKTALNGNLIIIVEPSVSAKGDYDEVWLGNRGGYVLDTEALTESMAMADTRNRFQVLDIVVGDLRPDGTVEIKTKKRKTRKYYEGGVSYSTLGQDASARDLVSLRGATHIASGVRGDISITKGLPSLREDSKGGEYGSVYGSLRKATPYGEFTLAAMGSRNTIGGEDATAFDYQLGGDTARQSLSHRYHFQGIGTLTNTVTRTTRSQEFGLFDLTDEQRYNTWELNYNSKFGPHVLNLSYTKGLSGYREHNLIPLMGTFNEKFNSYRVGYGYSARLSSNFALAFSASLFGGDQDMPSSERMSLGGPGRGSSHNNGVVSGYKGGFAEARLYVLHNLLPYNDTSLRPYLSINGGETTDAIDTRLQLASAELGLLFSSGNLSAGVNGATSILEEGVEKDSRLNFNLSYSF